MFRLITIFILILFSQFLGAQNRLVVESSDYKNELLLFYTKSDYITNLVDTVAFGRADENGAFSAEIKEDYTRRVFIDLGVYHCSFYLEPEKDYNLNLPKKRLKTKAEELNIYFEPIGFRIGIKNISSNDLNPLISSFDKIYTEFIAINFDTIYHYPQSKLIEKFEDDMNNYYSEVHHPYFDAYRHYKINEMKFLGPNRSYQTITFKYYNNKEIHYYNPSYMHLFNLMYKDFFNLYAQSIQGNKLPNLVKEGRSPSKIKRYLDQNNALSDGNLEELIILKGIHDELFNPRLPNHISFARPQIKIILDSIKDFSSNKIHRKIASNIIKKQESKIIYQKEKKLGFSLISREGELVSLEDFKGKYVYLNFMRTDVPIAMESMDRMRNFYKSHKNDIEIVSIFTDSVKEFAKLDTSKYPWVLLHIGENKSLLETYNVITWPQFNLISPEGKAVWLPAPSLKEHFEIRFFDNKKY